ncbi:hypothetical protein D3C71_1735920 [compost metagenome]
MTATQWVGGFCVTPAARIRMRGLSADASDLGKGFDELGLNAGVVVFQMLGGPGRAGLHGPALYHRAARFGRLAGQPRNAVVGAACSIPLWA